MFRETVNQSKTIILKNSVAFLLLFICSFYNAQEMELCKCDLLKNPKTASVLLIQNMSLRRFPKKKH